MCVTNYVIYEMMYDNTTLLLYNVTNNYINCRLCAVLSSVTFTQFCLLHFVPADFATKGYRQRNFCLIVATLICAEGSDMASNTFVFESI